MKTLADNASNTLTGNLGCYLLLEGEVVDSILVTATRSAADLVVAWTVPSGGVTSEVSTDGGTTWVVRTSPWTYIGAANASHLIMVRIKDANGNVIASGTKYYDPDTAYEQNTVLLLT